MSDERIATGVGPDQLDIAYETRGDPADPTVLLVMGIAAQLVHWPDGLLDALVARGLHEGVFGGPRATTRQEVMDRAVRTTAIVGSPAYAVDPALTAERAGVAWDRDHNEASVIRQAVASVASGDRTPLLRNLDLPTLVVHGLADTMCDPSGGRATAAAIPGAELLLIEGMGHNLPPQLWQQLADAIAANVRKGEARSSEVS